MNKHINALAKINSSGLSLDNKEDLKVLIGARPNIGDLISDDTAVTDSLLRKYLASSRVIDIEPPRKTDAAALNRLIFCLEVVEEKTTDSKDIMGGQANQIEQTEGDKTTKPEKIVGAEEIKLNHSADEVMEEEISNNFSEKLVLLEVPKQFEERYGKSLKMTQIYVRSCYEELYAKVTTIMLGEEGSSVLFLGVPGIGNSMFLIYFLCRYVEDPRFTDKRFAFEPIQSDYGYYTPIEHKGEYRCSIGAVQTAFPLSDILLLTDIEGSYPPLRRGKWTLIFSSSNPLRYKNFMKVYPSYTYYLPTWSEFELWQVNRNKEEWYERFVKCGGVARIVLWKGTANDPMNAFELAFDQKGAIVAEYFFKIGFGNVDSENSYALVHINPPTLPDGSLLYDCKKPVHTFASDYVFERLQMIFLRAQVTNAANWFNAGGGFASEKLGAVSAGHLFEKMCLWLVPLSGLTITPRPLDKRQQNDSLSIPIPTMERLAYNWRELKNLQVDRLYQPLISNFEFGNSFCLLQLTVLTLIVFQITVGEKHPVKANGLKSIVQAFPESIRSRIGRKLIVFVTPMEGKIRDVQSIISQKGKEMSKVSVDAQNFEQWVYCHKVVLDDMKLET